MKKNIDKTDWERLKNMKNEDKDFSDGFESTYDYLLRHSKVGQSAIKGAKEALEYTKSSGNVYEDLGIDEPDSKISKSIVKTGKEAMIEYEKELLEGLDEHTAHTDLIEQAQELKMGYEIINEDISEISMWDCTLMDGLDEEDWAQLTKDNGEIIVKAIKERVKEADKEDAKFISHEDVKKRLLIRPKVQEEYDNLNKKIDEGLEDLKSGNIRQPEESYDHLKAEIDYTQEIALWTRMEFSKVVGHFEGNVSKSIHWFKSVNPSLGHQRPIDMLKTDYGTKKLNKFIDNALMGYEA